MEIWKDIEGYEELYQISSEGRIKSCERKIDYLVKGKYNGKRTFPSKILNTYKNNNGYFCVDLHKNGKRQHKLIHRLVAEAFIPNQEGKPQIDHINTDKTDNRVENLRWVTQSENMKNPLTIKKISESHEGRTYEHLHCKETREKIRKSLMGHKVTKETKEKISKAISKPIYQYNLNGELIAIYQNSVVAEKETGFSQAKINQSAHGKFFSKLRNKWYYKNEYKGYKWSFLPL